MRIRLAVIAPLTLVLSAPPALAQDTAAGHWLLAGKVGGTDFTLDCRFQQAGATVSGVCVDGETHDARVKGGRAHTLTKGRLVGDRISFAYQTSKGIFPFEADYAGVLKGDHMSGKASALTFSGVFTADRQGP